MDAQVLAAQKWVNATYKGVSGYNVIPEDGNTGWTTMYALTRALQHELGIASLSDTFGPTTLSLLTSHGAIGSGETNANIVKIVQCGFYCKGYNPGGIDGSFGPSTIAATQAMTAAMGLGASSTVAPKVVKSLLTMDAYVVLSGGTDAIRTCQQWLNSRYLTRANFFVIPCDGIYSRSVQTALTMAIQFELGQSDAAADGIFGPNTRTGLSSHVLATGSTGVWVQLFTAAMIVNQAYATFTSTFDATVAAAVTTFQTFSALTANGTGDIGTWAQLLVSYGDQSRPYTAADFITTVTDARAASLKAAGVSLVGRYLDENPNANPYLNKKIQPGELATVFANQLRVFPISQYDGQSLGYFSWASGFADGRKAHDAAAGYGFDTGTVIYFACDYDATQADIAGNIVPYFRGVSAGLASRGDKYVHGVYSTRNVCSEVSRQTYARWSFVSDMSSGYSGNMGFTLPANWAFNQIQTVTLGSGTGAIQIDKDVHKPGTDTGVGSVGGTGMALGDFVDYIARLYAVAQGYGGANTSALVLQFLRSPRFGTARWTPLIGDADPGFLAYMAAQGQAAPAEFVEPAHGVAIHVDHWAAACGGGPTTARADFAGWAGDWTGFYGEWRRDGAAYASGSAYCQARLAAADGGGTFGLRDLIEDADGYHIGVLLAGGLTLPQAVQAYYQGTGYLTRMRDFVAGRFGLSAAAAAKDALLGTADAAIVAARAEIVATISGGAGLPATLPTVDLDDFCQGFADTMTAQAAAENAERGVNK